MKILNRFLEKILTAGTNFTRPPVATVVTNLNCVYVFSSYFYVPADKPPRLEHLPSLLLQWKGVPAVEMDVGADNLFPLLYLL